MALPQGWQTPAGVPKEIQDRVLQSYEQYWSPYNQARMAEEGSGWNINSALGRTPWNYGFGTEGLSPEALSWLGPQAQGAKEFANVDPFAADWGRANWSTPKPEGFLDSGMGAMIPLALLGGTLALGGLGLGGAATAAPAAESAALGSGLSLGAGGETGLTLGAGGATGLTAPASTWAIPEWSALAGGGAALGTGLTPGAGGETGLTFGAGGETGLTAPTGLWDAAPAYDFAPASTFDLGSAGGAGLQPTGGTGLKVPANFGASPTSYTPTGWMEKGQQMLKDYLMPGGKMSLASLLNPVSSIASGFMQSRASKDAALSQVRAAQEAANLIRENAATQNAALAPYSEAGKVGLSSLLSGLAPGGRFTGNFTGVDFQNEPGYLGQLEEGQRMRENSAAAKGLLKSGRTAKELAKYAQELASRTYGDAYNRWLQQQNLDWNRNAALAGIGQTSANQLTSFGNQNVRTLADLLGAGASAQGAGAIGSTNAWTGTLQNLLNANAQQEILDIMRRRMGY